MPRTTASIPFRIFVLLPALALLGGCGEEMRKSLGLGKNAPDEFQVVRRADASSITTSCPDRLSTVPTYASPIGGNTGPHSRG